MFDDIFKVSNKLDFQKHFDEIINFRKEKGLPKFLDLNSGTVAKVEINGKTFFGINSSLSPESLNLRKKWFNSIEKWVPPKKRIPKNISSAQSFLHAEAHSLMNAYEKLGKLNTKVTIFVDRKTCNMCVGELPILMKKMKIEELTIINDINKNNKIIIKLIKDEIQVYRY